MTFKEPIQRQAQQIALKLKASGIPFGFLVSAADFVLRNGGVPKDSVVLAEARRQQKQRDEQVARFRAAKETLRNRKDAA